MTSIYSSFEVMWSQVDPNGHLRHSVYYDLGAQTRVNAFNSFNLTINDLVKLGVGPILFREEARFKREILLNDMISIDLSVLAMRDDGYKWSFEHNFYRKDVVVATVTVEGAWMDLRKRKVTIPPDTIQEALINLPKAPGFTKL